MDLNNYGEEHVDIIQLEFSRQQLLILLQKECLQLYQQSILERKQLHQIEWDAQDGAPSILGEVEVKSDAIAGCTSWIDRKGCVKNVTRLIGILKQYSIYESPILIRWLVEDGKDYPMFSTYVHLCEHVRMLLLEWLQENCQGSS